MIRDTSIDAYRKIEAEGLLSKLKWDVYSCLFKHGPMTQGETWKKHFPKSQRHNICPRFAELERYGVIKSVGTKPCPVSGVEVMLWDVTSKLPKRDKRDFRFEALKAKKRYQKAKDSYRQALEKWKSAGCPA